MSSKVLLSFSLIVINIINSFCPQVLLASETSKNEEEVRIVDKVIKEKDDYVDVDVIIPQISGISNKSKEAQINKEIENWTLEWIKDIRLIAKENFDTNVKPLGPYEANARYEVKNTRNPLSFYIDYYQFTGGAHGITTRKYYNIDKRSGEILKLNNLFKEKYDYASLINKQIQSEIDKNKDMYFTGKDGFQGIKDNQGFFIEGSNLVIFFAQYEIAPYAGGMPEFRIPLEIFKKGYVYDKINSK